VFALPHVAVVLAPPDVHSALEQQPAIGTHRFVFGQFLNVLLQAIPHIPVAGLHTAIPLDIGAEQEVHPGPQKLVLVSD
jgi:hypothetical protein